LERSKEYIECAEGLHYAIEGAVGHAGNSREHITKFTETHGILGTSSANILG